MASVHVRKNRAGKVISYQVRWRDGGTRDGRWQSESFEDAEGAGIFKDAVNESGQRWPAGWVKGEGFISADDLIEERYRFRTYARRCIENRTGLEGRTRRAYLQELESWILPTFGECDIRSTEHRPPLTCLFVTDINLCCELADQRENIWLRTKRKDADGKEASGTGGVCYVLFPTDIGGEQRAALEELGIV